jgi:hypothetical protein
MGKAVVYDFNTARFTEGLSSTLGDTQPPCLLSMPGSELQLSGLHSLGWQMGVGQRSERAHLPQPGMFPNQ